MSRYTNILQALLTQGLCQMLETQVFIRCREADQPLVEGVIPAAQAEYKAKVGKECTVRLDTENWLNKDW